MSNTIHKRRRLRHASQNTKLPTRARPNNPLPSNRLPIHQPRLLDIVIRALSGAISITKAPAERPPITRHRDRVIRPRRAIHSLDTRNRRRHGEDLRVPTRVTDEIINRERVELDADLEAIDAAPGEALLILGDGDAVELAAVDADDLALVLEGGDDGGVENDGFVAAGAGGDAGLAVVVEAPRVDFAVLVDGEGVGVAGGDVGHGFGEAEFAGDEAVEFGALHDAAAELVLLARAPGEDGAVAAEGEDVVGACGEFGDFFEAGDEGWVALDLCGQGEAEDALVALRGEICQWW